MRREVVPPPYRCTAEVSSRHRPNLLTHVPVTMAMGLALVLASAQAAGAGDPKCGPGALLEAVRRGEGLSAAHPKAEAPGAPWRLQGNESFAAAVARDPKGFLSEVRSRMNVAAKGPKRALDAKPNVLIPELQPTMKWMANRLEEALAGAIQRLGAATKTNPAVRFARDVSQILRVASGVREIDYRTALLSAFDYSLAVTRLLPETDGGVSAWGIGERFDRERDYVGERKKLAQLLDEKLTVPNHVFIPTEQKIGHADLLEDPAAPIQLVSLSSKIELIDGLAMSPYERFLYAVYGTPRLAEPAARHTVSLKGVAPAFFEPELPPQIVRAQERAARLAREALALEEMLQDKGLPRGSLDEIGRVHEEWQQRMRELAVAHEELRDEYINELARRGVKREWIRARGCDVGDCVFVIDHVRVNADTGGKNAGQHFLVKSTRLVDPKYPSRVAAQDIELHTRLDPEFGFDDVRRVVRVPAMLAAMSPIDAYRAGLGHEMVHALGEAGFARFDAPKVMVRRQTNGGQVYFGQPEALRRFEEEARAWKTVLDDYPGKEKMEERFRSDLSGYSDYFVPEEAFATYAYQIRSLAEARRSAILPLLEKVEGAGGPLTKVARVRLAEAQRSLWELHRLAAIQTAVGVDAVQVLRAALEKARGEPTAFHPPKESSPRLGVTRRNLVIEVRHPVHHYSVELGFQSAANPEGQIETILGDLWDQLRATREILAEAKSWNDRINAASDSKRSRVKLPESADSVAGKAPFLASRIVSDTSGFMKSMTERARAWSQEHPDRPMDFPMGELRGTVSWMSRKLSAERDRAIESGMDSSDPRVKFADGILAKLDKDPQRPPSYREAILRGLDYSMAVSQLLPEQNGRFSAGFFGSAPKASFNLEAAYREMVKEVEGILNTSRYPFPPFLFIPTERELGIEEFVLTRHEPVYFLGLSTRSAIVDGFRMTPFDLYFHDIFAHGTSQANRDMITGHVRRPGEEAPRQPSPEMAEWMREFRAWLAKEKDPKLRHAKMVVSFHALHERYRSFNPAEMIDLLDQLEPGVIVTDIGLTSHMAGLYDGGKFPASEKPSTMGRDERWEKQLIARATGELLDFWRELETKRLANPSVLDRVANLIRGNSKARPPREPRRGVEPAAFQTELPPEIARLREKAENLAREADRIEQTLQNDGPHQQSLETLQRMFGEWQVRKVEVTEAQQELREAYIAELVRRGVKREWIRLRECEDGDCAFVIDHARVYKDTGGRNSGQHFLAKSTRLVDPKKPTRVASQDLEFHTSREPIYQFDHLRRVVELPAVLSVMSPLEAYRQGLGHEMIHALGEAGFARHDWPQVALRRRSDQERVFHDPPAQLREFQDQTYAWRQTLSDHPGEKFMREHFRRNLSYYNDYVLPEEAFATFAYQIRAVAGQSRAALPALLESLERGSGKLGDGEQMLVAAAQRSLWPLHELAAYQQSLGGDALAVLEAALAKLIRDPEALRAPADPDAALGDTRRQFVLDLEHPEHGYAVELGFASEASPRAQLEELIARIKDQLGKTDGILAEAKGWNDRLNALFNRGRDTPTILPAGRSKELHAADDEAAPGSQARKRHARLKEIEQAWSVTSRAIDEMSQVLANDLLERGKSDAESFERLHSMLELQDDAREAVEQAHRDEVELLRSKLLEYGVKPEEMSLECFTMDCVVRIHGDRVEEPIAGRHFLVKATRIKHVDKDTKREQTTVSDLVFHTATERRARYKVEEREVHLPGELVFLSSKDAVAKNFGHELTHALLWQGNPRHRFPNIGFRRLTGKDASFWSPPPELEPLLKIGHAIQDREGAAETEDKYRERFSRWERQYGRYFASDEAYATYPYDVRRTFADSRERVEPLLRALRTADAGRKMEPAFVQGLIDSIFAAQRELYDVPLRKALLQLRLGEETLELLDEAAKWKSNGDRSFKFLHPRHGYWVNVELEGRRNATGKIREVRRLTLEQMAKSRALLAEASGWIKELDRFYDALNKRPELAQAKKRIGPKARARMSTRELQDELLSYASRERMRTETVAGGADATPEENLAALRKALESGGKIEMAPRAFTEAVQGLLASETPEDAFKALNAIERYEPKAKRLGVNADFIRSEVYRKLGKAKELKWLQRKVRWWEPRIREHNFPSANHRLVEYTDESGRPLDPVHGSPAALVGTNTRLTFGNGDTITQAVGDAAELPKGIQRVFEAMRKAANYGQGTERHYREVGAMIVELDNGKFITRLYSGHELDSLPRGRKLNLGGRASKVKRVWLVHTHPSAETSELLGGAKDKGKKNNYVFSMPDLHGALMFKDDLRSQFGREIPVAQVVLPEAAGGDVYLRWDVGPVENRILADAPVGEPSPPDAPARPAKPKGWLGGWFATETEDMAARDEGEQAPLKLESTTRTRDGSVRVDLVPDPLGRIVGDKNAVYELDPDKYAEVVRLMLNSENPKAALRWADGATGPDTEFIKSEVYRKLGETQKLRQLQELARAGPRPGDPGWGWDKGQSAIVEYVDESGKALDPAHDRPEELIGKRTWVTYGTGDSIHQEIRDASKAPRHLQRVFTAIRKASAYGRPEGRHYREVAALVVELSNGKLVTKLMTSNNLKTSVLKLDLKIDDVGSLRKIYLIHTHPSMETAALLSDDPGQYPFSMTDVHASLLVKKAFDSLRGGGVPLEAMVLPECRNGCANAYLSWQVAPPTNRILEGTPPDRGPASQPAKANQHAFAGVQEVSGKWFMHTLDRGENGTRKSKTVRVTLGSGSEAPTPSDTVYGPPALAPPAEGRSGTAANGPPPPAAVPGARISPEAMAVARDRVTKLLEDKIGSEKARERLSCKVP